MAMSLCVFWVVSPLLCSIHRPSLLYSSHSLPYLPPCLPPAVAARPIFYPAATNPPMIIEGKQHGFGNE